MSYITRDLMRKDVAKAADLLMSMWMEHVEEAPRLLNREYIEKVDVKKYLSKYLNSSDKKGFVAISDNKVVGLATVEVKHFKDMHNFKKLAYFDNLVVHPNFRRHGIADGLVSERIKWMEENKITAAESKIYAHNMPSQNLMRKHGFKEVYSHYYWFRNN